VLQLYVPRVPGVPEYDDQLVPEKWDFQGEVRRRGFSCVRVCVCVGPRVWLCLRLICHVWLDVDPVGGCLLGVHVFGVVLRQPRYKTVRQGAWDKQAMMICWRA
jgi:hypothetical protein